MDKKTLDKYKRNMTIRPVRKGVEFTGEVYFEDLTEKELNELIYVLDCGDEDAALQDKKHGYKLGSGKPYGLGSIATAVEGVDIVLFEADHDHRTISRRIRPYAADYSKLGFDQDTLDCFEKMTDFAAVKGNNVSYPYLQKPGPGKEVFVYEWFTDNHGKYDKKEKSILKNKMANSRSEMVYVQYLKPMEPVTQSILEDFPGTPSEAASEGEKADYSSEKTEEKKGDRGSGGGNMASGRGKAVWIGAEELLGDMKKKLAALHGSKLGCAFIKAAGKLNQQLLQSASKEYAILLISDRLNLEKDFLLMDFAGKNFEKIYQSKSKKEGKKFKECDWKVLK